MFASLPISSTFGVAASTAQDRITEKSLEQEDFLKLLVAQMTSLDPLNPKTDFDFLGQMAQLSVVEQSRSMQSDISLLRTDQQVLQASSLLGRQVEVQADEETRVAGLVESVQFEEGSPKIVVGGELYDLSQLLTIAPSLVVT